MKKIYSKPLISVEELSLDQPIATTCTATKDDMELLTAWGYFAPNSTCGMWIGTGEDGHGGKIDWNRDEVWDDEHGTVCYHSNITVAFMS